MHVEARMPGASREVGTASYDKPGAHVARRVRQAAARPGDGKTWKGKGNGLGTTGNAMREHEPRLRPIFAVAYAMQLALSRQASNHATKLLRDSNLSWVVPRVLDETQKRQSWVSRVERAHGEE